MRDDDDFFGDREPQTFLQRYGLWIAVGVFVTVGGASAALLLKGGSSPAPRPHNEPHITQVQLPPPPPPPPPPKVPPPPQKQQETSKPKEAAPMKAATPAPKAPSPPAAVTTSIQGNGPGSLAVGNGGGGDCIGSGCGSGDGTGGDNDAYYSQLMTQRLKTLLSEDEKLKYAKYKMTLSFSIDAGGHVAGATIASFSGDDDVRAEVERALRSATTGDTPVAGIVGKTFTVRITERARA